MTLGQRIKAARTAAKLTQAQLAERCNWDPPSRLANYEQGIREPSLADLRIIANNVQEGGHTFARIVLGDDVEASQPRRLDREIILAAVRLASGAATGVGLSQFQIETENDAELFALAIEEVMDDGITQASDSDVHRFVCKLQSLREEINDEVGTVGSDGGAHRTAGKAQTRDATGPTAGGKRKRAAGA